MNRARGVVPPQLVPTWGALPRLAWAQARAFGPQPAPRLLGWILAVVAVPLWLCGLAGTHGKQGVAARGHRSVVLITRISRVANPRAIALLFGLFCLLLVAAAVATIAVGWFWLTIVCAVVVIGLASMRPWVLVGHQAALGRVYAALRQGDPDAEVYEVGGLAAWPRGQGYGWELFDALLAEADVRGYVVLIPRDEDLRSRYLDRRMIEYEPGGALYLDLRAPGRPAAD